MSQFCDPQALLRKNESLVQKQSCEERRLLMEFFLQSPLRKFCFIQIPRPCSRCADLVGPGKFVWMYEITSCDSQIWGPLALVSKKAYSFCMSAVHTNCAMWTWNGHWEEWEPVGSCIYVSERSLPSPFLPLTNLPSEAKMDFGNMAGFILQREVHVIVQVWNSDEAREEVGQVAVQVLKETNRRHNLMACELSFTYLQVWKQTCICIKNKPESLLHSKNICLKKSKLNCLLPILNKGRKRKEK